METKVLTAKTAHGLNEVIRLEEMDGWKVVGGHQTATTHQQNIYAGRQHTQSRFTTEYSVTMVKDKCKHKAGQNLESVAKLLDEVQTHLVKLGHENTEVYNTLYDARCGIEDVKEDLGFTTE